PSCSDSSAYVSASDSGELTRRPATYTALSTTLDRAGVDPRSRFSASTGSTGRTSMPESNARRRRLNLFLTGGSDSGDGTQSVYRIGMNGRCPASATSHVVTVAHGAFTQCWATGDAAPRTVRRATPAHRSQLEVSPHDRP